MTTTRPKILIVDDEESVIEALTRLLRKSFTVVTASSGNVALDLLRKHSDCAIIVTDYQMPGISGIEFLRQAKKLVPNAVRIILSGQIHLDEISEAINNIQIHRFFLKPWDNDYLLIQMQEALQAHLTLTERNDFRELSIMDPVTNLTNHRYFQETLLSLSKESLEQKKPLTLIMVDVDHFKSLNDHYGHPEGDYFLGAIAERLAQHPPNKKSVSRYGGEEFSILLPDTDLKEGLKIAEDIRHSMDSTPFTGQDQRPIYITITAGVASIPENATTSRELIHQADQALLLGKKMGRNQVKKSSSDPA